MRSSRTGPECTHGRWSALRSLVTQTGPTGVTDASLRAAQSPPLLRGVYLNILRCKRSHHRGVNLCGDDTLRQPPSMPSGDGLMRAEHLSNKLCGCTFRSWRHDIGLLRPRVCGTTSRVAKVSPVVPGRRCAPGGQRTWRSQPRDVTSTFTHCSPERNGRATRSRNVVDQSTRKVAWPPMPRRRPASARHRCSRRRLELKSGTQTTCDRSGFVVTAQKTTYLATGTTLNVRGVDDPTHVGELPRCEQRLVLHVGDILELTKDCSPAPVDSLGAFPP